MNATEITTLLNEYTGKDVQVAMGDVCETPNPKCVNVHVNGKLEKDQEVPDAWYVRVKDDFYGSSGVSFMTSQVTDLHKLTYQLRIDLGSQDVG